MKAFAVGIFSAFVYSYGLWVIARHYQLNADPVEAGIIKGLTYTFVIALPFSIVAHSIVAFRCWKILWMIPISCGLAISLITFLSIFQSPTGQLINILAFLGEPLAFSIPYALILNRRAEQGTPPNQA